MPRAASLRPTAARGFAGITVSKLKTLLRKENARRPEEVERSIGELLSSLTPTECCNFFSDAGYTST